MENQHRHIKGYRDLSSEEVKLINKIKGKSEEVGELLQQLTQLRETSPLEGSGNLVVESSRCLGIAKENLQTGFMWFIRAVALPESF